MEVHLGHFPLDSDMRRRQLARRLTLHQARTQTICKLTGLSRHQLAGLRQRWQIPTDARHRGPAPTSLAIFHSSTRLNAEAAVLAVMWRIHSRAHIAGSREQRKDHAIEQGEKLCDAFEAYAACVENAGFCIEHLTLLVRALEAADSIALSNCGCCGAMIVVDLLAGRQKPCSHCRNGQAVSAPLAAGEVHEKQEGHIRLLGGS
jgi:hypothetical protein